MAKIMLGLGKVLLKSIGQTFVLKSETFSHTWGQFSSNPSTFLSWGSDVNDSYGRRFLSLYSWWSILCLVGMHKKTELNFLSIQSNFPHPSQKYFEQNKEMTFDRKLANVTDPVIRGLYYPSTQNLIQKSLHEITVNSQS